MTLSGGSQATGIDDGVAVGGGGGLFESHVFASPAIVWDAHGAATYLQAPPGSNLVSIVTAISGNQVTGYLAAGYPYGHENDIPAVWDRRSGAATQLSGGWGEVFATDGTHQVGAAGGTTGMGTNAAYWSGTNPIQLILPSGFWGSQADGVDGNSAVGEVYNGGHSHAALWQISGKTSTFTSFHPDGYYDSYAFAISHGQTVGQTSTVDFSNQTGRSYAALWTGLSANSFVPLTGDQITASAAYGTNGTQQVGYVSFDQPVGLNAPADHHAVVWHGTSASMQLLPLPKGFVDSVAYGIDQQGDVVGQMTGPQTGTQAVE